MWITYSNLSTSLVVMALVRHHAAVVETARKANLQVRNLHHGIQLEYI